MVRVRAIVRRRKYFSIAPDEMAAQGEVHPYRRIGSGTLQLSPLGVPGTNLKVGTECKGHGEVIPGRWWSELRVIHTN